MHNVVTALLLGLFTSAAWAGGLWLYEMGTPDLGTAAAGRAALASDPSTAFGNPAGMTRLQGSQLLIGFQPAFSSIEFDPGSGTTVAGSDGGNAGGFLPGLSSFFVYSASPDIKLGLSLVSYAGGLLEYEDNWVGRYYVQESDLLTAAVNPVIAYRVNDWLSVGGGPSLVYGYLKAKTAINNVLDRFPDGQLKFEDSDVGYGGNIGILLEPRPDTRFGITYITKVDLDFKDTLKLKDLGPGLNAILNRRGLLGSRVDMGLTLPQQVMASGYYEVTDRWALMANVGWQNWEKFGQPELSIDSTETTSFTADLDYKDTWHVAIGGQYRYTDRWLFSAGFAYDSSPVSNSERSPALPMDRQLRFGTGVQYRWKENLTVGAAYEFLDLGDADIDRRKGPLAGTLQGDYKSNHVNFFAVNVDWRF